MCQRNGKGAVGVAIPPVVARILSGDSTSPLTREARVVVRGEGLLFFCNGCVGMAVFGATGGASKASDRCSFTKISENNKDWCNGSGKPTPLRKANRIAQI